MNINRDDPALQRWLGTITKAGTRYGYTSAFKAYTKYTNMTASELIDEALDDSKRDVREKKDAVLLKLLGFYNWLKTEYERKSRGKGKHKVIGKGVSDKLAHMYVSAIRSFYSTFDIHVRLKGRRSLPKPRVENKRMRVGPDQVKTLVDHARNPRDRSIILTLFQSGMDVSTLCSLRYGDVAEGLKQDVLKLELYRPKTGVEYYTFLGRDAIESLKAYLADARQRGINFSNDRALFLTERGANPLKTHNVQNMLREVAVKSGLVDKENNGKAFNPLSPHALRESFGSIMINSGVPDTVIDFWLGHSIGEMAEAYKGLQYKSLRKMYVERERLLSISHGILDAEEIERKVEDKVDERIQSLQRIITSYAHDNLELKEQVKMLSDRLMDVEKVTEKWQTMTLDELKRFVLEQAEKRR